MKVGDYVKIKDNMVYVEDKIIHVLVYEKCWKFKVGKVIADDNKYSVVVRWINKSIATGGKDKSICNHHRAALELIENFDQTYLEDMQILEALTGDTDASN